MKKSALVFALAGWLFVGGLWQPTAYASQFSNGLRKTWGYIFSPVNCAAQWVSAVVSASTSFVQCVLNNANVGNLVP